MKLNYQQLWEVFNKTFSDTIQNSDKQTLFEAWKHDNEWTKHYFQRILPEMARKLNMKFNTEAIFHIDGVFSKIGSQNQSVPIIYIESENNIYTSDREIVKLCSVNAPLKVLITYTDDWSIQLDLEKKDQDNVIDYYWRYIIEDYSEQIGLVGFTAIIVVEPIKESLNFYSLVFDQNAAIIENNLMFSINK